MSGWLSTVQKFEVEGSDDFFDDCQHLENACNRLFWRMKTLLTPKLGATLVAYIQDSSVCFELVEPVTTSFNNLSKTPRLDVKSFTDKILPSKVTLWRRRLHLVRLRLLMIMQQLINFLLHRWIDLLDHSPLSEQFLQDILKLINQFNLLMELESLLGQSKGLGPLCLNTCPTVLHPLRKISLTKIIQTLCQRRAESCCRLVVRSLLLAFGNISSREMKLNQKKKQQLSAPRVEPSSPSVQSDSSLEVCRELVGPEVAVSPVEAKKKHLGSSIGDVVSVMNGLARNEERLAERLLEQVAIVSPNLMGKNGVKQSKESGTLRARRRTVNKSLEYHAQTLWTAAGGYMDHVVLWWSSGRCLGVEDFDKAIQLRDFALELIRKEELSPQISPALQALADGLICHVTSTKWDSLFRKCLIKQSEASGELFANTFRLLVSLTMACEKTPDWLQGTPSDELPLVEQIVLLHRLDHTLHTCRLWAEDKARKLANSWSVGAFFTLTHQEVEQCLEETNLLKLTELTDLHEATSQHVIVCGKMRMQLVSEVEQNHKKLIDAPRLCVEVISEVSRTYSLANLRMNFPLGKYWKNPPGAKGAIPNTASPYVSNYLDKVLSPVLQAVQPIPSPVAQEALASRVMSIVCEAWLDHIYMQRIKFSDRGALQLLADFGGVPTWLAKQAYLKPPLLEILQSHQVLRRCEGVARLLLRLPGERIDMDDVEPTSRSKPKKKPQRRDSDSPQGEALMPAEMYVPNQEQWLELRASTNRKKCLPCC